MSGWALAMALLTAGPAQAAENVILLGDRRVVLDAGWRIIAHRPQGAVRAVAVQIPDANDEGTEDSTNLSATVFDVRDTQAMLAFTRTMAGIGDAKEERHGAWDLMLWSGKQGATDYRIWDCVLRQEKAPHMIHVRLAFPQLAKDPADHEQALRARLLRLLDAMEPPAATAP